MARNSVRREPIVPCQVSRNGSSNPRCAHARPGRAVTINSRQDSNSRENDNSREDGGRVGYVHRGSLGPFRLSSSLLRSGRKLRGAQPIEDRPPSPKALQQGFPSRVTSTLRRCLPRAACQVMSLPRHSTQCRLVCIRSSMSIVMLCLLSGLGYRLRGPVTWCEGLQLTRDGYYPFCGH